MKNFSYKKGNTLIEMLVYISIFAVLSIAIVNVLVTMMKSFSEVQAYRDLAEATTVSLERITREIKGATSVDVANSTFNSSPGILQLNTTDSGGAAKTVKFDVSSNQLRLTENGTVTGNIVGGNMSVTSLIFRNITTSKGTAIRIEMTMQNTRGRTISKNFYSTAIIKGAY